MKTESENKNVKSVIQPNTITSLIYIDGVTAIQLKVINHVVLAMQNNMTKEIKMLNGIQTKMVEVPMSACVKGDNKDNLRQAIKSLVGKKVSFEKYTGEGRRKERSMIVPFTAMFETVEEIEENGLKREHLNSIFIKMNDDFLPLLLNWSRGFTLYDYEVVKNFRTCTAISLYQLLCRFADRTTLELPIPYLREQLDISKGYTNSDIRKDLQRAQKEINDSNSWIKCKEIQFWASEKAKTSSKKKPMADMVHFEIECINEKFLENQKQRLTAVVPALQLSLVNDLKMNYNAVALLLDHIQENSFLQSFASEYQNIRNVYYPACGAKYYDKFKNTVCKKLKEEFKFPVRESYFEPELFMVH